MSTTDNSGAFPVVKKLNISRVWKSHPHNCTPIPFYIFYIHKFIVCIYYCSKPESGTPETDREKQDFKLLNKDSRPDKLITNGSQQYKMSEPRRCILTPHLVENMFFCKYMGICACKTYERLTYRPRRYSCGKRVHSSEIELTRVQIVTSETFLKKYNLSFRLGT